MLNVGDKAPNFTLPNAYGEKISLSDFKGKKVVLYFYPKDNTPGCSAQACSYRDKAKEFESKDTVIIGISKDSQKSHEKFIQKYDLPFILLSDPDHEIIDKYGCWQKKKMCGKEYMGTVRSTFIIDKDGIIVDANYKSKSKTDADEVERKIV